MGGADWPEAPNRKRAVGYLRCGGFVEFLLPRPLTVDIGYARGRGSAGYRKHANQAVK